MATEVQLPHASVRRYVEPLREGGSLPAIVETDAEELVVAKWRGAGQGATALVAEVIVGELARAMALPMPGLMTLEVDAALSKTERDPEIQELLAGSVGLNLGMGYLGGALAFDPAAKMEVDADLAARIVMFDSYVSNVDRTPRNTNLLWWKGGLWLIDHGAALYWHHGWDGTVERHERGFPMIRDHVLLPVAGDLRAAGGVLRAALTDAVIEAAVAKVPSAWLPEPATERRGAYVAFLQQRREHIATLCEEASRAADAV
jgi:hypothetical protein